MTKFIDSNVEHFRFAEFLQLYVDILYPKLIDFACEFGVSSVVFSQFNREDIGSTQEPEHT